MRVLIFGGTGMIGRTLARQLAEAGDEVAVVSRRPPDAEAPDLFIADLRDADAVRAAITAFRPDCVVQLAAMLQQDCETDPAGAVAVNVTGLVNVLEAAREAGVARVVFASSIAAYGERHDLMREDDPPAPSMALYGETKRLGEALGQRYQALHGLGFVALRYSGVFGPGAVSGAGLALARQKLIETAAGRPADLDFVSGEERVHMTHVEDSAAATLAVIRAGTLSHGVYNVAGPDGNYMSLKDFHGIIRRLVPGAAEARFTGAARGAGPCDTSRLREDLGFIGEISVEEGLARELT